MSAVKIFAFLGLEPRLNNKNGFNWAGKIEHFSKVSSSYLTISKHNKLGCGKLLHPHRSEGMEL